MIDFIKIIDENLLENVSGGSGRLRKNSNPLPNLLKAICSSCHKEISLGHEHRLNNSFICNRCRKSLYNYPTFNEKNSHSFKQNYKKSKYIDRNKFSMYS